MTQDLAGLRLTRDKPGKVYQMTDRGRQLRELADAVGLRAW